MEVLVHLGRIACMAFAVAGAGCGDQRTASQVAAQGTAEHARASLILVPKLTGYETQRAADSAVPAIETKHSRAAPRPMEWAPDTLTALQREAMLDTLGIRRSQWRARQPTAYRLWLDVACRCRTLAGYANPSITAVFRGQITSTRDKRGHRMHGGATVDSLFAAANAYLADPTTDALIITYDSALAYPAMIAVDPGGPLRDGKTWRLDGGPTISARVMTSSRPH